MKDLQDNHIHDYGYRKCNGLLAGEFCELRLETELLEVRLEGILRVLELGILGTSLGKHLETTYLAEQRVST